MKRKGLILSSYVLILLFVFQPKVYGNELPNPKIVIIGAGPAGIAAATKLHENGFKDLIILEAESRIGDRVNTIKFADNFIDLGAQWCHGEKNNVVYEIVKDLNVLESSSILYENATINRSNGEKVSEGLRLQLQSLITDIKNRRNSDQHENITVYDFFKSELYKELEKPENQLIDKNIADEYFTYFDKDSSINDASDTLAEMSMSNQADYEQCEGDNELNWKDKGYKEFLNILMETKNTGKEFGILDGLIKLSKKIQTINWQREDFKVLIECEDGEEILADHVIVTVSLGVLKHEHEKLFKPNLLAEKKFAIENINFGSVSKIFLEFKEKFWPEYWTGFSMLWMDKDLNEIRNTENAWLEGVYSFNVYNLYQPRILEGWVVGSFGRHIESLPDDVVKNETLLVLRKFLPWELTEVVNFKKTDWFTNPNFRGTYSYHSMKTYAAGVKPYDLETPLTITGNECTDDKKSKDCERPIVLFAGEATHEHHYSTVHGAVESGWREAERLIDFYKVDVNI